MFQASHAKYVPMSTETHKAEAEVRDIIILRVV